MLIRVGGTAFRDIWASVPVSLGWWLLPADLGQHWLLWGLGAYMSFFISCLS